MAKRRSDNKSSKPKRIQNHREAAQRTRLFWGAGLAAAVIGIFFFAFSGNTSNAATDLSDAEVANLPVGPQIGARAPDFSLNTARGSKAALSDFRGKPMAIMFFHSW